MVFDKIRWLFVIGIQEQSELLIDCWSTAVHIHIDPVGGVAGDMFVAAMLDLFPHLEDGMLENLRCVKPLLAVDAKSCRYNDDVLTGKKFIVEGPNLGHQHSHFVELVSSIKESSMNTRVKDRACEILKLLSQAEATVHGIELEKVTLHEIGSPDSLADIVCSSYLIDAAQAASWSSGSLPSGKGSVQTAHGEIPLPAPAVVQLLKGYPIHNDDRVGERVTPTGAAIIRYLNPDFEGRRGAMTLSGVGYGFGTRKLTGVSNVLRLTAYEEFPNSANFEKVAILTFEVDDQSLEDLGIGLDRLRTSRGVLDVIQMPATGKKNRMAVHVQVLAKPEYIDDIASRCVMETSTLGVRIQIVERMTVPRASHHYELEGCAVPLKVSQRPDGTHTAKVEADHLQQAGQFSERKRIKQKVETEIECNPPKT